MRKSRLTYTFVLIVVILIGIRALLPSVVQWYVNNQLDRSEQYSGRVGDIDLHLYRGAYQINDVEINKTIGDIPVPLFSARTVDFSVFWGALLNGAVVGEAIFYQPVLNIVDNPEDNQQQTGRDGNWLSILDDLIPLRLDQITVRDGEIHFRNFVADPPVDIYFSDVNASLTNLTNSLDLADSLVASLEIEALAMQASAFYLSMDMAPSINEPNFDLNARLIDLPILELDEFISAYAPFDVEAGTLDIVTELVASDNQIEGYIKPIIYDLDVFKWQEDIEEDGDNPLRALWEGLVGFLGEILQNQPQGQVATNIPISGELDNPETGVLATIGNILRNAFIEAFRANFENTISFNFNDENNDENNKEDSEQNEAATTSTD